MDAFYLKFKTAVSEGRKLDLEVVEKEAQGNFYKTFKKIY